MSPLQILVLGLAVVLLYSAIKGPTGGPLAVIRSVITPATSTAKK